MSVAPMRSSGSSLMAGGRSGGVHGARDGLCFDVRAFAPRPDLGSAPAADGTTTQTKEGVLGTATASEFDAHAFVTQALAATNPSFAAQLADDDYVLVAAADSSAHHHHSTSLMPAHSASPQVPLELLREHLTSYQLHIKHELIELLNTEYSEFIGLSSSLSGLDTRIAAIQSWLRTLAHELTTLQTRVAGEALQAFEGGLLRAFAARHKQATVHALMHVLDQMQANDAQLKANDEEDADDSVEESKSADATAHGRLVAHHLATARAHALQRASEQKQRGGRGSSRQASQTASAYEGLRIDIPRWMVTRGGGGASTRADEDEDEDESENEDEDQSPEDLNRNDAFGLYQALLNVPTTGATYTQSLQTATGAVAPVTSGSDLTALTARLVRLERVAHSLASLSPLVRASSSPLAHFHMVRDLRHVDGRSGAFDHLERRTRKQATEALKRVLRRVALHFATDAPVVDQDARNRLRGLVRTSLRIFTFLDARATAEELVREALVAPLLQQRVQAALPALRAEHVMDEAAYWTARDASTAAVTVDPLERLYEQLLALVRGPLQLLADCARAHYPLVDESPSSAASTLVVPIAQSLSFSFLPASFFSEFARLASGADAPVTASSDKSGRNTGVELSTLLFSTGLPHLFLAHFTSTRRFLAALETAATEHGQLATLHAHPAWATFAKRWNVGLYFQLRFQQIAGALETALDGPAASPDAMVQACVVSKAHPSPLPPASNTLASLSALSSYSGCLRLASMRALWTQMLACFSPRTFLRDLAPRFLKLALQGAARVLKHAESLLVQVPEDDAGAALSHSAPLLLLLHADAEALKHLVREHLLPLVLSTLAEDPRQPRPTVARIHAALAKAQTGADAAVGSSQTAGDDTVLRLVAASFAPTLQRMQILADDVHARLVSVVSAQCRLPLQCVPRISAAYRGTRRKQPAHPFKYVRGVLSPLVRHLVASDSGVLTTLAVATDGAEEHRREVEANEWMADDLDSSSTNPSVPTAHALLAGPPRAVFVDGVVRRVLGEYESKARDCIADVSRFEELSKKLGKRPVAASSTAAPSDLTDSEKTRRQLVLDVGHCARLLQDQIAPANAGQLMQSLVQTTRVQA